MSPTQVSKVRTQFDIPGFRQGSTNQNEFRSGFEFEQFMFGYHSESDGKERYESLKFETPELRGPRPYLFLEAVLWSIINEKDFPYLAELYPPCFAPLLYRDVQGALPQRKRHHLQMYAVVGTPFDYDFGVDLIFILDDAVVTLDVTINPTSKNIEGCELHHFMFSNFQLSPRATSDFAKRVASALQKKGHHKILSPERRRRIEDAIHTRSTVI